MLAGLEVFHGLRMLHEISICFTSLACYVSVLYCGIFNLLQIT